MAPLLQYLPVSQSEIGKLVFVYPANEKLCGADRILLEIGPGRGDFLFHLAENNPDAYVVGVEIKRKRTDKLIRRVEKRKLNNVNIIQDDARKALPRFFKDNSVDSIYINFPDPWPKRRHMKNRVLSRCFLSECNRILKLYGNLNITTDHSPYADDIAETASCIAQLETCFPEVITNESPDAYPTFFAQKWIAQRRSIYYQKYQKII